MQLDNKAYGNHCCVFYGDTPRFYTVTATCGSTIGSEEIVTFT
jgi:hypothetical protein